jgi:predicted SnoaL-like aldol condensation-catalyzing enzyme
MSLLHLEVVLKTASRKSDDSVTVKFETQTEMSNEQFAFIDSFRKQTGHLLFKKDTITSAEVPKGNTSGDVLSPSQELKKSLYAVWKAKTELNKINEDWDTYYQNAIAGFKRAVDRTHPSND